MTDLARARREAADLYAQGLTLVRIAKLQGISAPGVMLRLRRLGVERRRSGLPTPPITDTVFRLAAGETQQDLARELGLTLSGLRGRLYPRGFKTSLLPWLSTLNEADRALVREALDHDHLTFADAVELVEDARAQNVRDA